MDLTFLQDGNYGSLTGGLIGGLLAGIAAILTATYTLRKTAESFTREERARGNKKRKEHFKAMIQALFMEVRENLQLNEKGTIRSRKVFFANEAWSIYKSSTYLLPHKLQRLLIIAYNELKIFNSIIAYDIANRNYRETYIPTTGAWNDAEIETQASHVRDAFKAVRTELEKLAHLRSIRYIE